MGVSVIVPGGVVSVCSMFLSPGLKSLYFFKTPFQNLFCPILFLFGDFIYVEPNVHHERYICIMT